jgi:hypothetical protein
MEWFKHSTRSHEDPDISDAWDIFGDAGPVVFWTILEVFGIEYSHLKDDWLTLSVPFFERKLRRKYKKIEKILEFFKKRERIYYKKTEFEISITIPKFIRIASNWTIRPKDKPTPLTTEMPTEAPTAKEEEKKKKRKEKNNNRTFIIPIVDEIKAYCVERKNTIDAQLFFDKYTGNGWMVGKNKMKDWKAVVRTWEKNDFSNNKQSMIGVVNQPRYYQSTPCKKCGMSHDKIDLNEDGYCIKCQ